jgi:hypothetical protein
MPGKVGNPRIKDHSRVPLGSVGESTLRRMVSALVRSMNEPGMSASMKLKLTKEINALRVELSRMRVERARRTADRILSQPDGISADKSSS